MTRPVGIDFGSQTSRVAVFEAGESPELSSFKTATIASLPMAKRSALEKIQSLFLEIKASADKLAGEKISKAVISMPACWSAEERSRVLAAAQSAGLEAEAIYDSTAALLAYGVLNRKTGTFALTSGGAGYFEICIADLKEGALNVRARRGAPWGGQDINHEIAARLQEEIRQKLAVPFKGDSHLFNEEIQKAKIALSHRGSYDFEVSVPGVEKKFAKALSRYEYQEWTRGFFKKVTELCWETLSQSAISKEKIQEVILAGGALRGLFFQDALKKAFEKPFCAELPLEFVVVYGAAIKAAMLAGEIPEMKVVE